MQHHRPRAAAGSTRWLRPRGSGRRTGPSARVDSRTRSSVARARGPRPDRRPHHQQERAEARTRCRNIVVARTAERRHELAVHQRPVREHELRVRGAHVRADEQQRDRDAGGPRGRPRERAVAADRPLGGVAQGRATATTTTSAISASAVDEVSRHPPRIVLRQHDDAAQHRLRDDQRERGEGRHQHAQVPRRPRQATRVPSARSARSREHHDPVRELDERVHVHPPGTERPGSHAGQVLHPRPEPVPRTSPPTVNSTTVVTAAARASLGTGSWARSP